MTTRALAALTACLLFPALASAVEVTAGGLVNPLGYVGGAGVEFGAGDSAGIEVRGSYMAYAYDETDYHEEGSGPMLGVRARWYAQDTGNATRLWLGGGMSAVSVTYYWRETDAGAFVADEETTTTVLLADLGIGYKILLGDERFVIDPQLFLGYFLNAETDTNVIAGLGISAGMRF